MDINLTNCDREPIHIPGKIQSYGYLLGVDIQSQTISYVSNNIGPVLSLSVEDILGKNFREILSGVEHVTHHILLPELIQGICLYGIKDEFSNITVIINGEYYHMVFNMSGDSVLLLELEKVISSAQERNKINQVVRRIMGESVFESVVQLVAKEVKELIRYDHVMIYKFLSDGSGKVIAEARNPDLGTYLDLHFPESDIPKQARALYVRNKTRLIADSSSEDEKIFSISDVPLDLSNSKLRAVSPVHIEYLKNMGVSASFSVSIVKDGQLWGLIACHNYSPKRIDFEIRLNTELLGEIISSVISTKVQEEDKQLADKYTAVTNRLQRQLITAESIPAAVINKKTTLLDLTRAEGVTFHFEDQYYSKGVVPPLHFVQKLYDWFLDFTEEDIFFTNKLMDQMPEAEAYKDVASGVFIRVLSRETRDFIIWYKPERKSTIQWAGKPEKIVAERIEKGKLKYDIHPRKSFEAYTQYITATSKKWFQEEVKAGTYIKDEILEAALYRAKELKNLNAKLTEAYEELNTFSYTVSHDLKNPLTVIKTNAQLLLRTCEENSSDKLRNIINKVDDVSFMMDEILNLTKVSSSELVFKTINMTSLLERIIQESKIAFEATRTKVIVENALNISGDPTMIYQLFSNVVNNAIKYSAKVENPRVVINSYSENGRTVYSVEDNGIGIDNAKLPKIFDVFERFDNATGFQGTGLGMAIAKRIVDKHHGEIKIESTLGEGSKFYLYF